MSGEKVLLDLNNPEFQGQLFELAEKEQRGALLTLRKISRMTWAQVYGDVGLNWEAILSKSGPRGARLYSLRMGKGFRAVAYRHGDYQKLLSLHPDHDSAYR